MRKEERKRSQQKNKNQDIGIGALSDELDQILQKEIFEEPKVEILKKVKADDKISKTQV